VLPFTLEQVQTCWSALPRSLRDTPFYQVAGSGLCLKLETFQPTRSYKIRAAYWRLKNRRTGSKAVALSSSGNFASGFTWAAAQHELEAHLVVTDSVSPVKMALAQNWPCQVHVSGSDYESRFEKLAELEQLGIEVVDHRTCPTVFLGHATVGWECFCHHQNFDRVLIPVSTGGLAIGVAAALRLAGFEGEILGVQPAGNPTVFRSWEKGAPIPGGGSKTVCDALTATSIPEEAYLLLRELLDDILLVKEESVLRAVGYLALETGVVAEPGAAVGVAALLEGQREMARSLCLVTGANLEPQILKRGVEAWQEWEKD